MAERKIRHALVSYTRVVGDATTSEIAFRGQVVDIPEDQAARLDALGATVPVEEDLPRPGKMLDLPETATGAEILSWVMGATKEEVADLVKQQPVMAERIESAVAAVQKRYEEQNAHLGGLRKIAKAAEAKAKKGSEKGSESPSGGGSTEPQPPAGGDGKGEGGAEDLIGDLALTAEGADEVVAQGAKAAADYISEHPRQAALVLEAEGRLAEQEKRDARVSIVRAAEAAAGFTQ